MCGVPYNNDVGTLAHFIVLVKHISEFELIQTLCYQFRSTSYKNILFDRYILNVLTAYPDWMTTLHFWTRDYVIVIKIKQHLFRPTYKGGHHYNVHFLFHGKLGDVPVTQLHHVTSEWRVHGDGVLDSNRLPRHFLFIHKCRKLLFHTVLTEGLVNHCWNQMVIELLKIKFQYMWIHEFWTNTVSLLCIIGHF